MIDFQPALDRLKVVQARIDPVLAVVRRLWLPTMIVLATVYLYQRWDSVSDLFGSTSWTATGLVIVAILVVKWVVSEQARLVFATAARPPSHLSFYRIYTLSDMSKYVPGGVMAVASRIQSYRQLGLSTRLAGRTFGVEKAILVTSAALGGLVLLSVGLEDGLPSLVDWSAPAAWRPVEATLLLMLWIGVTKTCGRYALGPWSWRATLRSVADQFVINLGLGIALWLPVNHLVDGRFLALVGAFNIARAVGLVAIFAPAGLGVREAVAVLILNRTKVDADVAVFALGANRLLTTVAEVIGALVVLVLVPRAEELSGIASSPLGEPPDASL